MYGPFVVDVVLKVLFNLGHASSRSAASTARRLMCVPWVGPENVTCVMASKVVAFSFFFSRECHLELVWYRKFTARTWQWREFCLPQFVKSGAQISVKQGQ